MPAAPEPLSARYFALLYSPEPQKRVLEALFGIEHEISDSLRPGMDHQVAHARLEWWRDECERAVHGNPAHPLARSLIDALDGARPAGLGGFVDVAIWDLAGATFETRRELTAYCGRWSAAMFEPFGTGGATTAADPLRALGAAAHEVELLNDLAREAHHGRLRIPLDELDRIGVDPGTLAQARWPDALVNLVRSRLAELRSGIAQAITDLGPEAQPPLRGLLVWAAIAARTSARIERTLPSPSQTGRFDGVSASWSAWRVARRATLKRFRLQ